MGFHLSKPITQKFSSDETGENVAYGVSSMQGWRVSQEDAHNCCIKFDENASLFAVYDGHGGHEVAHYCSKKLPDFIKETEAYKRGDIRQALIEAFIGFDATLIKPEIISILKEIAETKTQDGDKNESCDSGDDSGCTAVVALLHGQDLYVANAGDSRCVLCRDGEALELSLDHKPEDIPEMERIVKAGGKITPDGRVNGGLNLSRAIGDHSYKQNTELPPEEQMISALPDVRHVTIDPKRDEFLILACDGIWDVMSCSDAVQFVKSRINEAGDNISKICEELFDHCLAPDTNGDRKGCDNMTAVIVKFKKFSVNNKKKT